MRRLVAALALAGCGWTLPAPAPAPDAGLRDASTSNDLPVTPPTATSSPPSTSP
ncbi:MAG: hypothetical protein R3A48_26790 [Polyangiales bacterium]